MPAVCGLWCEVTNDANHTHHNPQTTHHNPRARVTQLHGTATPRRPKARVDREAYRNRRVDSYLGARWASSFDPYIEQEETPAEAAARRWVGARRLCKRLSDGSRTAL